MHIWDLRTCTHAHLGFADLHILDLRTCTHAHLGFADLHKLRTCTLAHTRFADLHIRDLRECNCFHVVATWQPRGEHVVTTWKQLHSTGMPACNSINITITLICYMHFSSLMCYCLLIQFSPFAASMYPL